MRHELNAKAKTSAPWRVGVLFSKTGFLKVIEETQLTGTLTAIDEINALGGVNGRPLEPVIYDPGSETGAFGRLAKKLMIEDGITCIFGCYTSSSRRAVLPVVERLNGLLWYPTVYEGFEYSPNVIYTGAAPNQNSVKLCRYLMETYGNRFYFIGSEYCYPRASNRIMRELVVHNGGEVVGEDYVPLSSKRDDFKPVMRQIDRLRPDIIFSTVVGDSTTYLYQSYTDKGFDPKVMPIASLTTSEAEIRDMGFDVGMGHITAAPYFQGLDNDCNSSFVRNFKKRYGDDVVTNMCLEAAYFQVFLFAKALEEANSMGTEILRPAVLGTEFEAPQGKISINEKCAHANLWTRIGRANRKGQFEMLYESKDCIDADPYLVGYGRTIAFR